MKHYQTNPAWMTRNRAGVTLLFVISMIVLFLLLGTAFVIVSNDFFQSSIVRSKREVHRVDGKQLVEQAFRELVRGPDLQNLNSPLKGQEILADQYGYGLKAYIGPTGSPSTTPTLGAAGLTGASGSQLLTFSITSDATGATNDGLAFPIADPTAAAGTIGNNDDFFLSGLVLTFIEGNGKGYSSRIVNHRVDRTGATPIHYLSVYWPASAGAAIPQVGDEIIINGHDFAGGFTTPDDNHFYPNYAGESLATFQTSLLEGNPLALNEPWDAADGLNWFLSGYDRDGNFIPSFVRNTHDNYADNNITRTAADPGSKDFFAFNDVPIVDSDNDGVNDAIWMDIGFGVRSTPDGLRFKPLVAYHVIDLDGRANLNAHGNWSQLDSNSRFISTFVPDASLLPTPAVVATSPAEPGMGMGPAEFILEAVFANDTDTAASNTVVRDTTLSNVFSSRYAGTTNDGLPGTGTGLATQFSNIGLPVDNVNWTTGNYGTVGRMYGSSPMDIAGRFRIVMPEDALVNSGSVIDNFVDPNYPTTFRNGLPVIDMLISADVTSNEIQVSPYEMNLVSLPVGDANDTPFTEHELERLLRPNDIDTQLLDSRLWRISDPTATPADWEEFWNSDTATLIQGRNQLVTTRSFDVPMIYESIQGKLRTRIAAELLEDSLPALTDDEMSNRITALMSQDAGASYAFAPELGLKLKMDINRPFGNGNDGNGNGVIDEPAEFATEVNLDQGGAAMDLDNNGTTNDATDANARVIFARHLYMLALLLNEEPNFDFDGSGTVNETDRNIYRRRLAQWAVNVVDFRDTDSIMTRFIYDQDPWDATGWDTDLSDPDVQEVWGCERPELLLSETMAVHANRTEDLADFGTVSGGGTDTDFDQRLRPEAYTLIELYNPWTQNRLNQRQDPSLYDTSNASQGVHLGRANVAGSPVWRLAVERPERGAVAAQTLRFVYFTNPDSADVITDDNAANVEVFYPSTAAGDLRPGSHAVIGSFGTEDPNAAGEFLIPFGRLDTKLAADESGNLELDMTNHIRLLPGSNQVTCFPADADANLAVAGTRQALIVGIDTARAGDAFGAGATRSFNLSDRFGGYPTDDSMGTAGTAIDDGLAYPVPYDEPFDFTTDANRNEADLEMIHGVTGTNTAVQEGMVKNFRTLRLQRLADPTLAFNALTNPYLTIDSMEVDLVTFNGVRANDGTEPYTGPEDASFSETPIADQVVSLERGEEEAVLAATQRRQLFGFRRPDNMRTGDPGAGDHYYDVNPTTRQSFGKTNDAYTEASTGTFAADSSPYAWLVWNNRPFANNMELMNVPFLAPDELTYSPNTATSTEKTCFEIDDSTFANPYDSARPGSPLAGRFGHLLNFYARGNVASGLPNFYKILEYTEVPSRFSMSRIYLTDSAAALNPFNHLSRYRVPGTINLNTIPPNPGAPAASAVWNGMAGAYTANTSYINFRDSIKGDGTAAANTVSTDFGNPFRPSEAFARTLPDSMADGYQETDFLVETSKTGLLRDSATIAGTPMFDYTDANSFDDRNSFHRNLFRQRLAGMATTKSSVFAVWVTIGFFEVDETGALRPGAGNGIELGLETGEVQRHRGFFIFDRSIPVGFEPGKNHNIENAVIVKSIIE